MFKNQIGLLGGTFDPVHIGHLLIAEESRVQLKLDRIVFIPAGRPGLRENAPEAIASDRVEMVSMAIGNNRFFDLSTIETKRPGKTYTVDTIKELKKVYGAARAEFYFIIGWDALTGIPFWRSPDEVVKLCWLVAVNRPGYRKPSVKNLENNVPGISKRLIWLDVPPLGISATDIRRRVREGVSIRYLVPAEVEKYIKNKKLYRS